MTVMTACPRVLPRLKTSRPSNTLLCSLQRNALPGAGGASIELHREFWRLMARRRPGIAHSLGALGFLQREHGLPASHQQMRAVRLPSAEAIRATIAASLRHSDATLDGTADALKISARTLQRHLGRMGTSHSEMLADVRLDMACRLLVDTSKRLSDIAKILGYSNASSFSRTFVRLMKVQPVVYRRQQLARKHGHVRHHKKAFGADL